MEAGKKRYKLLTGKNEIPKWANKEILSNQKYGDFWKNKKTRYKTIIPLHKVIGTEHADYNGRTWLEMLGSLKRLNLAHFDHDFFIENLTLPGNLPGFKKYGDEYVITEGNHRVCIAKFLGIKEVKGYATDYDFDKITYETYQHFIKLGAKIEFYTYPFQKDQYIWENWMIKIGRYKLYLSDTNAIQEFKRLFNDLNTSVFVLIKAYVKWVIRFIFSSNEENNCFINSLQKQFKSCEIELIKIKKKDRSHSY